MPANNVLPALVVKKMPIDKLAADPKNARKHGAKSIDAITRSLCAYGQQKPIVVTAKGMIVAGHGTLMAAAGLGWTEIDVVVTKLKEREAKAFALMDNRSAELSEWDHDVLGETLHELREQDFELSDTGFDLEDFEGLYGAGKKEPARVGATADDKKQVSFEAGEGSGKPGVTIDKVTPSTDIVIKLTADAYAEFSETAKFLQTQLQIPSLSELMLELVRSAKADLQSDVAHAAQT